MDNWKNTDKDKKWEELISELRPLLRKSKRLDYGSSSTKKSNHVLSFDYEKYEIIIELK